MNKPPGTASLRNQPPEAPMELRRSHPAVGRWLPLLIAVGTLFLLGFYTVTDSSRLANSQALEGADWVGYAICHRITSHSFTINGRQLPLCARCTGIYLGIMLTFVVLFLAGRLRRSDLPPTPILLVLTGFVGVMGIDGINSYLHFFPNAPHLYEPQNWLRLITGMGTGLAMGLFVFPALAQTLWRYHRPRPVITSFGELGGIGLVAAILALMVLSNQSMILYVLAMTSAAGVLLILTSVQTILLLLLIRRDGRATSVKQAAAPLLGAVLLTLIEIGVIGFVRYSFTGTMTGFPGL